MTQIQTKPGLWSKNYTTDAGICFLFGVNEEHDENCKEKIKKIISEKLQIRNVESMKFCGVHRVGRKQFAQSEIDQSFVASLVEKTDSAFIRPRRSLKTPRSTSQMTCQKKPGKLGESSWFQPWRELSKPTWTRKSPLWETVCSTMGTSTNTTKFHHDGCRPKTQKMSDWTIHRKS